MPDSMISITVLADNRAEEGLHTEHGLALWIETPSLRILFDTGQDKALEANASKLGVDLSRADFIVLSHGHYDHTGGLPFALRAAPSATVYCHPGAVLPRYALDEDKARPVQMPRASQSVLDGLPEGRLRWVTSPVVLAEGIILSGEIPRTGALPSDWPFAFDPAGAHLDPIPDDMALWIDTQDGLVLILGCCHAGLAPTLEQVRRVSPGKRIRMVLGGLHLMHSSEEEIGRTIDILRGVAPDAVIPLHCTGEKASALIEQTFGAAGRSGAAGMIFRL